MAAAQTQTQLGVADGGKINDDDVAVTCLNTRVREGGSLKIPEEVIDRKLMAEGEKVAKGAVMEEMYNTMHDL